MKRSCCSRTLVRNFVFLFAIFCCAWQPVHSQQTPQAAAEKSAAKPADKSKEQKDESLPAENPAQIELLETRVRFEENGDSRKEVHAHVKINSELGVRQFARLNFDFNRSFESVELPVVRVTHANGGTSDILPSAITDNPNPAVVNAPAYQDVRVKSVRILGLAPGDSLDYRVITTVTKHPLAPDFWLDHTFDRTGVVTEEIFELELPASLAPAVRQPDSVQLQTQPVLPAPAIKKNGEGDGATVEYRWQLLPGSLHHGGDDAEAHPSEPDVVLTTFPSWLELAARLGVRLAAAALGTGKVMNKELELSRRKNPTEAIYDFVSQKIVTVDLPLGSTGFKIRDPEEILVSGYGTAEDKVALFSALYRFTYKSFLPLLVYPGDNPEKQFPRPSLLTDVLLVVGNPESRYYLQPSLEVAPFGVVRADLRGKQALVGFTGFQPGDSEWLRITNDLPFSPTQRVSVDANLASNGTLNAKVKYTMRGENELLLRVTFHKTAKDKWKDLANLLAISDGFRGQVTSVNVSDPYATREPFTVDYEITMPKFVDWSNKPVRIPALLPQVALPDPPAKPVAGSAVSPIQLGTPLEVETSMTLHLPAGTTARYPTGTSVQRDYATFSSQYSAKDSTLAASRHIKFILREVPAARVFDYNAFMHAVQNDSAQDFILERPETAPAKTNSAAPPSAPPKTNPLNPTSSKP